MDVLIANDYKEQLKNIDNKWKNFKYDSKKVFTKNICDFISDEHIDIMVKYLYIKAYLENNHYEKYKELYEKMQEKRIGRSNVKGFNRVINSFKQKGYLKKYPIPINSKGKMLNGSHRLACCLYFNINPYVVEMDEDDHYYNIDWFKENGFSNDEIREIENLKEQLIKEYNKVKVEFENIYSAMITPLKDGKLDIYKFKKHANYLLNNGIKGLFVCGNTGNGMGLSVDIKKEILNTAISMKKFSVICHVGANKIKDIFDFVEYLNNTNVQAIACIPPYKEISKFIDIKKFYETLAKLSKKPLIIYHIPSVTGLNLSKNKIIELLNINNVVGMKYTDNNVRKLKEISREVKDKYIFFGRDDYLKDGLRNGAYGGIGGCYNLFPRFIKDIINGKSPIKTQEKLNYCIKYLRNIYPTLPGGEFVLKALEIKNYMDDNYFYNKIRRETNDKTSSI